MRLRHLEQFVRFIEILKLISVVLFSILCLFNSIYTTCGSPFHQDEHMSVCRERVYARSRLRSTCTSSTDSDECMQLHSEPSKYTVMSSSQPLVLMTEELVVDQNLWIKLFEYLKLRKSESLDRKSIAVCRIWAI
ncbi:hypothetical protein BpHYR1_042924 [Brachionus plicatilis]|uniref:Uncharacterized protein n=1 Tax=Brachionus plicatilis TaxID=10195 RepID=A0A3M7QEW3_BRAPC|nr:hypothetical protein BpHYR1_042924 [Brachionus plicatilis]